MTKGTSLVPKVLQYFKKEWLTLSLFILIVSLSQTIILKPHLEFGFSPDDIWLFSDFSSLGSNPILKLPFIWESRGPHFTSPLYYNGLLFGLFGFNYSAYQVTALIFKIISIITFYLLISIIFKNKLLAFLSGIIYSFHYGSVGSMEMITRTQDYLVISGLNISLALFYLYLTGITKKLFWLILCSIILFFAFSINPIRAFPILPFICLLVLIQFFRNRSLPVFYQIFKNLTILFLPFILSFSLIGSGGNFLGNTSTIIQKVSFGNLQMILTPFSSFGSLFLTGDNLKVFSAQIWNLNTFLEYFFKGPIFIFLSLTFILSIILSQRPLKFFLHVFITNFIFQFLIFFAIDHGRNLSDQLRIPYDPISYTPSAVLGVYIVVVSSFVCLEWIRNQRNIYLRLYLLGITFAITFIWFTWIFQDYASIPIGIYGYATIPSMGISAAVGSILLLAFARLKNSKGLIQTFAPTVFLTLIPYFFLSNNLIQTYLTRNILNGNSSKDQIYLKDKFWSFIKHPESCNKFIYLDKKTDIPNGYFYNFIMIDRFDRWYSLYSPFNSKKACPVALIVNNEDKLLSRYTISTGIEGFRSGDFISDYGSSEKEDFIKIDKFTPLENFYAFQLTDRNITDITEQTLVWIRQKKK